MRPNVIKIVFIISTIFLVYIIGVIVIYSINYIDKNPDKYLNIDNLMY